MVMVMTASSQATYSTQCTQFASRLSNITTVTTGQINICSENAVWPPKDGRKDARNVLRNNWLTIKSLIVASSYLLIKDARSLEHKVYYALFKTLVPHFILWGTLDIRLIGRFFYWCVQLAITTDSWNVCSYLNLVILFQTVTNPSPRQAKYVKRNTVALSRNHLCNGKKIMHLL